MLRESFRAKLAINVYYAKVYILPPKTIKPYRPRAFPIHPKHRGQNPKQINIAKYVSRFWIYGAKMLVKCVKSQKKILCIVLLCKIKLSKMAFIKTNKIKKQTALL